MYVIIFRYPILTHTPFLDFDGDSTIISRRSRNEAKLGLGGLLNGISPSCFGGSMGLYPSNADIMDDLMNFNGSHQT